MSLTLWLPKPGSDDPLPHAWVERLFLKLQARYGTLFTDRFAGLPLKEVQDEWAEELAGFSGHEIARGLEGLRTCKFPPTLPEFMSLCRPPLDAQLAFHEAVKNLALRAQGEDAHWTHPAIYWAAIDLGWYDVQHSSYPTIKTRWEKALEDRLHSKHIEPVPPALKALPPPEYKPSPELAKNLHDLVEKMKMNNAKPTTTKPTTKQEEQKE